MSGEVDRIKEKLDLVEFLKGYLDLRPAGRNWKALCPFHGEKTPSFIVSPERQTWRCFGACGEGGDVFTFLMKHENLEFHEALKVLAERAGVTLQSLNPRTQKEFGILYDINEAASGFFQGELVRKPQALEYLKSRGLTDLTIEEFGLGYSPGGEDLTLFLLGKGYDISDVFRAGLVYKDRRGLYRDKFSERIIFPLHNTVGKTTAFTGRIVPWVSQETGSEMPKYMNSPETPIFSKSKLLYGFHESKNEIARERKVFVVEGQMDFLMVWQSGIRYAVAVSGTGLTPFHLAKLRRLADTALVGLDKDEAGMRALDRTVELLNAHDFHVLAVTWEGGKDPAEICAEDPENMRQAVLGARPAFRFLFETAFGVLPSHDIPAKKRLVEKFLMKIKTVKSPTEQLIWISELARISGIPEPALYEEFARVRSPLIVSRDVSSPKEVSADVGIFGDERLGKVLQRLFTVAFAEESLLTILREHEEWIPEEHRAPLYDASSEVGLALRLAASYENSLAEAGTLASEFHNLLIQLKREVLRRRQEMLRMELRNVRMEDNSDPLLRSLHEVSQSLDKL